MHVSPQRIHITGAPGSGKTTLSRQLSEMTGAPQIDLDTIAYEDGAGHKRTLEERKISIGEILQNPAWITEGIYLWWLDDLVDAADFIVWLDLPWSVSMGRIVARHARLSLRGQNPHRGLWKLAGFLWGNRKFYRVQNQPSPPAPDNDGAITREGIREYFRPHQSKLVRIQNENELSKFLVNIN